MHRHHQRKYFLLRIVRCQLRFGLLGVHDMLCNWAVEPLGYTSVKIVFTSLYKIITIWSALHMQKAKATPIWFHNNRMNQACMRAGGSLFIITILLSQVVAKCHNSAHRSMHQIVRQFRRAGNTQQYGFVEKVTKGVLWFACTDNIP